MKLVIEIDKDKNDRLDYLDVITLKEIIRNGKPLPEGHWIIDKEKLGYYISKCSACGHIFHGNEILIYRPKYCANCGAYMREGD